MSNIYKSIASVSAAAIVMAASLAPAMVSAYGDNSGTKEGRPVYTHEEAKKLGDTITFNSFTNGKIGDERNFVGAKVAGANVDTWNANEINVKDGETYTIRLYVHNNNLYGTKNIAKDVKATFSLPTAVAKEHTIVGYLDSSNATPTRYFDEVKLVSSEDMYLKYVDGSARYVNADANGNNREFKLSDNVITTGALLGYDQMDGNIPGCFGFDGVVLIDVEVHHSVAAKVAKTVRIKGDADKTWKESVVAKVGDEVEYQIEYVNLLAEEVKDVMIRDVLPTNVEYVKDSTYLYNSNYQNGVLLKDNTLTTTGINIGNYVNKGNAYVRFTGKVVDNTLACGANQLVNWASATVNGKVFKDDASVALNKVCDTPTPTPTPTPEPTPSELPQTGAATIVTGVIGAGSMATVLGYYIASRKKM